METLAEAADRYTNLSSRPAIDQIVFFLWFRRRKLDQDCVRPAELAADFRELGLPEPKNIWSLLKSSAATKRPRISGTGKGYKITHTALTRLDERLCSRQATVVVHTNLRDLSSRLVDPAQKKFLDETVLCFRSGAFRAACIMAWNLAYDQLCQKILSAHLVSFNSTLAASFKSAPPVAYITCRADFENLKEYDVVRISRKAGVLTENQKKICSEKLQRRNMLAHPSSIDAEQLQTEEMIIDLVLNIVLKI